MKINRLLLVDCDTKTNCLNEKRIVDSGLVDQLKVTLNGGHALLYLNQISHRTVDSRTVVVLNMNTPIADGFDFLEGYKFSHDIHKENVLIIVMEDNINKDIQDKVRRYGVNYFISSSICLETLNNYIDSYFEKNIDTKQVVFSTSEAVKAENLPKQSFVEMPQNKNHSKSKKHNRKVLVNIESVKRPGAGAA
jgi:response regulator RpfG family c-di-GMP phosphodiesterase